MHRALTAALAILAVWVAAAPLAAQDEIYLEITQPGLRRVAVAAPPLMVLPGTPADVAASFQTTLDQDLAAAAPIAVVDRKLYSLVEDDPRLVSYEDFLRWIKRDPQRHERFKEAQEARTEFLAGEILEIADGITAVDPNSNDTVNRDKLRIDTRKWLMSAHNKKRYGESKQIELAGSVSITDALAQAQARVIDVIDVTPRLEDNS